VLFSSFFDQAIIIFEEHGAMAAVAEAFHGPANFVLHGFAGLPVYLAAAGVGSAWYIYLKNPQLATTLKQRFIWIYNILITSTTSIVLTKSCLRPVPGVSGRCCGDSVMH
jgi:NADH-quinone oxidoreductase subunit L